MFFFECVQIVMLSPAAYLGCRRGGNNVRACKSVISLQWHNGSWPQRIIAQSPPNTPLAESEITVDRLID